SLTDPPTAPTPHSLQPVPLKTSPCSILNVSVRVLSALSRTPSTVTLCSAETPRTVLLSPHPALPSPDEKVTHDPLLSTSCRVCAFCCFSASAGTILRVCGVSTSGAWNFTDCTASGLNAGAVPCTCTGASWETPPSWAAAVAGTASAPHTARCSRPKR